MKRRVALLADYREEGWASMDHYAAMLSETLADRPDLDVTTFRAPFQPRVSGLSGWLGPRRAHALDCLVNRYRDYPDAAARLRDFEVFHILDQSYAHVAKRLPARRTIVTCHDLDFLHPPRGTRSGWLVRWTGSITAPGLRTAARVVCDSDVVRRQILARGLAEPDRLAVVPLGVEDSFGPEGERSLPAEAESRLANAPRGPIVLHVGATAVRKRLDLLLRSFAVIREAIPDATLVRAGGALPPEMRRLADELGVTGALVEMPFLQRDALAALYRRSDLFLFPSDQEGFGLPVLEALASGLPVVSRDLPTVREIGGDAPRWIEGGDPTALGIAAREVLADDESRSVMRRRGIERAAGFRWSRTADAMSRIYADVAREAAG